MEEKNILLQPYERPQHMLMRVALHLGQPNIKEALSIYSHLSRGDFIFPLSSMMLSGFKSPHLVSNYSISIGDSL